ncbi:MAG: tRNA uridine-5-carboxymethylaminomethyl(34) synthesis GTPase MnmE, partial [Oscillospiraceae bacterium]
MSKTIAAIATPQGKGGIGIVRISGDDAKKIADKLFHAHSEKSLCEVSGYTAHYGNIIKNGKTIDDAVALVFTAPKSYTGEDTVEISCHGGDYVVKQVLRLAIDCGAIPADRGEFTKMAFLNGKMDLAQAESVANIISAEGRQALISAVGARGGKISNEIAEIKASLLEAASRVAAFSDFPDEEPDFSGIDNLGCILNSVLLRLQNLLKNYDAGKILRNGINTVIFGKTNVGKSTLM